MAAAVMDRLRNALFSEDQAVGEAERAVVFGGCPAARLLTFRLESLN